MRISGGPWQGVHVVYYGQGKFRGLGMEETKNEEEVLDLLVEKYNVGASKKKKKEDLRKEGGGYTKHVRRPVVSETLKR